MTSALLPAVTVSVSSNPKGAYVTFGDEIRPRGKTPLTFTVPASDKEVAIEIDLPGHVEEKRKVKLTGNVDLEVALKKRSRSGSGGGTGRGTGRGTGGSTGAGDDVMDPFK